MDRLNEGVPRFNLMTPTNSESTTTVSPATPGVEKRQRTIFSATQLTKLERTFAVGPYITQLTRQQLSDELNLSERKIKIWFQNRRMKAKQEKEGKRTNKWSMSTSNRLDTWSTASPQSSASSDSGIQITPNEYYSENEYRSGSNYSNFVGNSLEQQNASIVENNILNSYYDPCLDQYLGYDSGTTYDDMVSNFDNGNQYNAPEMTPMFPNWNTSFEQHVDPMPSNENMDFNKFNY